MEVGGGVDINIFISSRKSLGGGLSYARLYYLSLTITIFYYFIYFYARQGGIGT
jgi:hypothetical protein